MLPTFSLAGSVRRLGTVATMLLFCGTAFAQQERVAIPAGRMTEASAALVDAGPLPASERLSLTLTLATESSRTAALGEFLTALQTPASASYRKWITPAEFGGQFGATAEQIAAAKGWAASEGLTVEATSASGMRMTVSGFASQWEHTLGVSLHGYRLGERA